MKRTVNALIMVGGLMGGGLLTVGCTQMPTEKQGISDMRPQISFKVNDDRALSARVILDGLDMGPVGDYLGGISALRVLSGTHALRVTLGSRIILDEKFYVGDGVSRTFSLN